MADEQLLLFLRGVNLNPGAEPEDMVSVRIFAEAQRVISLRLRPLRASDEILQQLEEGRGPKSASELLLLMGELLTEKVQGTVSDLSELVDWRKKRLNPTNGTLRRTAACSRSAGVPPVCGVSLLLSGRSTPSCRVANGAGSSMPTPITGTS